MSLRKVFAFSALALALLSCTVLAPAPAHAQISFGINIGAPPVCPYGYFDYAPYNCAPYGYYGPDWFGPDGIFIGAGRWFHGPRGFYGHVDNRYDPRHGYRGPLPDRGSVAFGHFRGNEARDGQGHVGRGDHDADRERNLPGYRGGGDDHRGNDNRNNGGDRR